jgi:hypothetical protein
MKKIFLLSLLSVLLLSAFPQSLTNGTEVLAKISVVTNDDDPSDPSDLSTPSRAPHGWWIFFWKYVTTSPTPDGGIMLTCSGRGWKICILPFRDVAPLEAWCVKNGIEIESVEKAYESLFEEASDRAGDGEYRGSVTKKIAFQNRLDGRETYLLFLMNWECDPKNPRNSKAEITISTTDRFGF